MVMLGFLKTLNAGKLVDNAMSKLDDSSLTLQEKAVGTVEFMERLGLTPSSVTRRIVTIIQIGFIISNYILATIVYRYNPEYAKFVKEIPYEYGANGIIQTINAFFYGGYYLSKNVAPAMKARIERKKQDQDIKRKEAEAKLAHQVEEDKIKIEQKRERFKKRNRTQHR